MTKDNETVTFGIIAYNEEKYLPDVLGDLLRQTYPHHLIEVVLVDGESTDETWRIMHSFREEHLSEFLNIIIKKNKKRVQPAGWNVVIKNATADVLLRIDAHARIPEDFIEKNIKCIKSGEYVCGGPRENIIDEGTSWKKTLLQAEQSMFGAGIALYRRETDKKRYVNSLFHGAYRQEVVKTVGFFNEELIRTEDNEYHYRIRKAGYKICYDPQIKSFYQTRSTLKGMLRQKYLNGLWIGKTIFKCPKCISVFHLVPLIFVVAIVVTTLLLFLGVSWPAKILWMVYLLANLAITASAFTRTKGFNICFAALPLIFLLLHVSYGIGTVFGIVSKH